MPWEQRDIVRIGKVLASRLKLRFAEGHSGILDLSAMTIYGPRPQDLKNNFDILYDLLTEFGRTRVPGLDVLSAVILQADYVLKGAVLKQDSQDAQEIQSRKEAGRLKVFFQYLRALRRKHKSSREPKLALLKSLIDVTPYKWSLARLVTSQKRKQDS